MRVAETNSSNVICLAAAISSRRFRASRESIWRGLMVNVISMVVSFVGFIFGLVWVTCKQKVSHADIFILASGLLVGYIAAEMMTKEQLRECRGQLSQSEMAKKLNSTPLSTYRKWEQGARKVPSWVEDTLRPQARQIPGLSLEALYSLDRQARAQELTLEEFIGKTLNDLAKTALAIAVLFTIGHQIMHPEDQLARRFSGRRREGLAAVVDADSEA